MSMPAPGTVERWVVLAILFAAVIAIALVAIHAFGIIIPPFVITIGWILVVALVAVAAVKFLMRMF